jgi:hypothetical protein
MNTQLQSVKPKRKPEKIYLRVIKGGLVPADQFAESQLRNKNYKLGDLLKADLRKLRNSKFNRLIHKLGLLVAQNIKEFDGLDGHTCLKRLQIEGKIACDEIGILVPGYGMVIQFIPRSLSFDSMDEAEFYDAAKKMCRLIAERYWKDCHPEQIENMANCMVDE